MRYSVTYGKQYFYLVNWDRDNSFTAEFEAFDLKRSTNAIYIQVASIAMLAAAIMV